MLRPYQEIAVSETLEALSRSGSAVLQMPTGAGKTKAATEIITRAGKPIWFICHRQEIERQAASAFASAGVDFGIVSPRGKPEYWKPVQIVSVSTLTRRIKDLPLPSLAIWDECHHVAAKSWAAIRDQLNGVQNLGLTATPERLDGKGLSEWFAELVVGPSTRELIDGCYLSDFRYFAPSDPDLASARLQAGDYRKSDLDKAMNTPVLIGDAIAEYRKNADGKRALVFCASVEASKALVERFNAEGIPAAHVDGTTPADKRDAFVAALAAGAIKVLSNVEVFTEGFDLPALDVVILLRPTKSLALFLQMIGRALRRADGKDGALIFDHAGLWLDHGWFDAPIEWSLGGGARRARMAAAKADGGTLRRCPECKEVRVERASVCTCGYEFQTGREIGEHDGQLMELRGDVPVGCTTLTEFASRFGVTPSAVRGWSLRGLPRNGAFVISSSAEEWVKKNINLEVLGQRQAQLSEAPAGHEKQREFASRIGATPSAVNRWVKRGLPMSNGYVLSGPADAWVLSNTDRAGSRRRGRVEAEGYMTVKEFARRHGRPYSGSSWVLCGLPLDLSLGVPIHAGDAWVSEHFSSNRRASSKEKIAIDGTLNRAAFAELTKTSRNSVAVWEKRGMPALPNGRIDAKAALEWASLNIKEPNIYPFWLTNADEFETRKSFARRVRVTQNTVTNWGRAGLPCSSNGWVHIASALNWLEGHPHHKRKFKIPPEAWPANNDNDATTTAKAA